ncbi:hypothetical protein Tco_0561735 [Tanacetum coccineum]
MEPSPGFGTGSPYISVNKEPLKANEEPDIQPVEVTVDFGGIPKPELFVVHPGSVAARIKDRKCLPDVLELKYVNACHLKISAITTLAWKNRLDNHIDLELLDLYDRCYARQAVVDNAVNRRSRELLQVIKKLRGECDVIRSKERARNEECEGLRVKCEAAMTDFEKNPAVVAFREKISALSTEAKEHKLSLDRMMLDDAGDDDICSLVGKLVSSAIVYGRCRAFEQVAGMKEPFDLSKVKGYRSSYKKDHTQASNDLVTATFPWLDKFVADPSAPIEALLSKKPPTLQRLASSRTQVLLVSSQRAAPSYVLASNLMSPPIDASVVKPQSSPPQ